MKLLKLAVAVGLLVVAGCTFDSHGIRILVPGSTAFPKKPAKPIVRPIITHELRVLMLEDPNKRQELPSAQLWMLTGKEIRDFLKSNCVKRKDSRGQMVPEFRLVDGREQSLDRLTGFWKKLVADHPPGSLPWAILSNGASVKSYALPDDAETFAKDLEVYAGVKQ